MAGPARRSSRSTGAPRAANRIRLKPHDAFELIRLIAQTQQDPRKAVAELVQNGLDAGATRVEIVRRRTRGEPRLVLADDGRGVHPEMSREEALTFIARNIGHSSKRGLTASERHRLMVQGQYGIGLLGFWSLGEHLEIKSRVAGSATFLLRLRKDDPRAELMEVPTPLDWPATRTEVTIRPLNDRAFRQVTGTKLASYLATELRGQLLRRAVNVRIHDRMSRGLAPKLIDVIPERYQGLRVDLPETLQTAGGPLGVELYLLDGGDPDPASAAAGVALYSGGTRVLDHLAELPELDAAVWRTSGLSGEVSFDGIQVAAATRRGLVNDDGAARFLIAMAELTPLVEAALGAIEKRAAEVVDQRTRRDLARLFADVLAEYPTLELPTLTEPAARTDRAPPPPSSPNAADAAGPSGASGDAIPEPRIEDPAGEAPPPEEPMSLLPPGPLAGLEIRPGSITLLRGQARTLHAIPRDAAGLRIVRPLDFGWTLAGSSVRLDASGDRATVHAGADLGEATVSVTAAEAGARAGASARVTVADQRLERGRRGGIPEPELVEEPLGLWRSRVDGDRWEINASHRDYRESSGRARLRYLSSLFAKEILLKTHGIGDPLQERLLEEMAGVIACTERALS